MRVRLSTVFWVFWGQVEFARKKQELQVRLAAEQEQEEEVRVSRQPARQHRERTVPTQWLGGVTVRLHWPACVCACV